MPHTSSQTSTNGTYRCFRCHRTLAATPENFYFRSDGTIISGCKSCHKAMSDERRGAPGTNKRAPGAVVRAAGVTLALGVVEDARPTPSMVQYRCEGCGRGRITDNPEGPRGWKRVRLTGSEADPASLCPRCTAAVSRAFQVMSAVAERRRGSRGKAH